MGILAGVEQARFLSAATANAVNDATPWTEFPGPFLLQATGAGVGTVTLEYSLDGGVTAIRAQTTPNQPNSFPNPVNMIVSPNPTRERGMLFRLRCLTLTSAPIAMRLSAGE